MNLSGALYVFITGFISGIFFGYIAQIIRAVWRSVIKLFKSSF